MRKERETKKGNDGWKKENMRENTKGGDRKRAQHIGIKVQIYTFLGVRRNAIQFCERMRCNAIIPRKWSHRVGEWENSLVIRQSSPSHFHRQFSSGKRWLTDHHVRQTFAGPMGPGLKLFGFTLLNFQSHWEPTAIESTN